MTNVVEIPALIDMHCHLREPGGENKETILTGSKSAYKGGFRTICPMPNTNPPCDSTEIIRNIIKKAHNIRILPIACVTKNLNSIELVDFKELKAAGAVAFSNDGLPILNKSLFKRALQEGELIISHCENETAEIRWQIEIFKDVLRGGYKPRLHFAHVSKKSSLSLIRSAKPDCPNLTAETAPHYFTFTKDDITDNGVFKMNPPLARLEDKKAVIEAVLDGTIDVISTDHAPHTVEEKLLPYDNAPNGITGFETALGLVLRVFDIDILVEKMALNPARILRIENKEKIRVDLEKIWIVHAAQFQSKCKISPYENMKLKGAAL